MKLLPSLESTNVDSAFFYFDGRFGVGGDVVVVGAAVETQKPLNERSAKKDVEGLRSIYFGLMVRRVASRTNGQGFNTNS